jgi:3-hydroxybenzoate 6-monooxygenase
VLGGGEPAGDGWAAYRAMVSFDEMDGDPGDEVVAWTGPDAHFARYPLRVGEAYEQVAVFRSHLYSLVGAGSVGGFAWGGPEELDEAFSWAHEPVRTAVRRMRRDKYWRMISRAPLPSWVVNRVVLLGDLVHPMPTYLAQGACQAIEDAAALADALADCSGPARVTTALADYQARRAPRAARVSRARQVWEYGPQPRRPADDYTASDWLYAPH